MHVPIFPAPIIGISPAQTGRLREHWPEHNWGPFPHAGAGGPM